MNYSAAKTTTYAYNRRAQLVSTKTSASGVTHNLVDSSEYNHDGDLVSSSSPESGAARVIARDSRFRPVGVAVPCQDPPVLPTFNTAGPVNVLGASPGGAGISRDRGLKFADGLPHACALSSSYDDADRLTSLTMSGGDDPSTYSFVPVTGSDLPSAESGTNATASYDLDYHYVSGSPLPDRQTITYSVPGLPPISFTLSFTRNSFAELTALNLNSVYTLHYTRDSLGRVTALTRTSGSSLVPATLVSSIQYQPNGSLMRLTTGNNILTDYYQLYGWSAPTYTGVYDLTKVTVPDRNTTGAYYAVRPVLVSSDTVKQRWGEYDLYYPSGGTLKSDNHLNPRSQYLGPVNATITATNSYDREDQLTQTAYTGGYTKTVNYAYDPLHNRTSEIFGATTTNYVYNAATNRLASATRAGITTSYRHDPRGNLSAVITSDHSADRVYAYDLMNRLVSVTANGRQIRYAYLANGMKYLKLAGNEATLYFYDPNGQLIYEETRNRETSNRISDTFYFYAAGLLIGEMSSGAPNTPGFVQRQFDPDAGLYYLNARWYDPQLGRFLSVDPIPGSLNQYAYAGNNPIRYSDPNGNIWGLNKPAQWAEPGFQKAYKWVDKTSENFFEAGYNSQRGPASERAYTQFQGEIVCTGFVLVGYSIIGIPQSFARIGTIGDHAWDAYFSEEEIDAYKFSGVLGEESMTLFSAATWGAGIKGAYKARFGPKPEVQTVVDSFNRTGGPPKGVKGGKVFKNIPENPGDQQLPIKPQGYYTETDIYPKVKGVDRGNFRLVLGKGGEVYYSTNHYQSFAQLKLPLPYVPTWHSMVPWLSATSNAARKESP